MIYFILGISLCLNLIAILGFIYIYRKVIKNTKISAMEEVIKKGMEFWDV